jgi:hypothetical protein
VLAPTEARLVAGVALVLAAIAAVIVIWPRIAAVPVAILLVWAAVALLAEARALRRARRERGLPRTKVVRGVIAAQALESAPDAPPDAIPRTTLESAQDATSETNDSTGPRGPVT